MQRKWDCCCKKKVQSKAKHAAVSSGAFKRKHSHALLIALSAPHVVFQSGNPTYHFRTLATNYISKSIVYSCTRSNKRVQIQRSMFVLAYLVLECLTKKCINKRQVHNYIEFHTDAVLTKQKYKLQEKQITSPFKSDTTFK